MVVQRAKLMYLESYPRIIKIEKDLYDLVQPLTQHHPFHH